MGETVWRVSEPIAVLTSKDSEDRDKYCIMFSAVGEPFHFILVGDADAHELAAQCACQPEAEVYRSETLYKHAGTRAQDYPG